MDSRKRIFPPFAVGKNHKDPAREPKTPLGTGSELDKRVGKHLLKVGWYSGPSEAWHTAGIEALCATQTPDSTHTRTRARGSSFSRVVVGDSRNGLHFLSGGETIFREGRCSKWAN